MFPNERFDEVWKFMFPNERFDEVCWRNMRIRLHALSLFYVSLHWM